MQEIEVKGWVDDFDAVKTKLEREASFERRTEKRDLYYGPEQKGALSVDVAEDRIFRLRSDEGKWYVTAKVRHPDPEVELSTETEFEVSCASSFRAFAQYLGYRPFVVKRKLTLAYTSGRALCELSKIDPLGDFLEVEIVLPDDASGAERREAADEVLERLHHFGVRPERVERRPYIDLLRKVGSGRPDVR